MKKWKRGAPYGVLKTEVLDETGNAVATVWTQKPNPETRDVEPWPEGEANLNLVVAAPELLEACKEALATLEHHQADIWPGMGDMAVVVQLKNAVAKARGK